MSTDSNGSITDPTTVAVKLTKLEMRMQNAERSIETLTEDVKEQLHTVVDKLDNLVTVGSCREREKRAEDDTKRWILEAVKAKEPRSKSWPERLKEKTLAITVIGGLVVGGITGIYQIAKYLARVEAVVEQSTRQVNAQVKQFKRDPVRVYVPYEPDTTMSPPPSVSPRTRSHPRGTHPRGKRHHATP